MVGLDTDLGLIPRGSTLVREGLLYEDEVVE